jgi:predicted transcriptional regulator
MDAGMAVMTHRCTFSLDKGTTQRIRKLAEQWNVSQAEVIRRAVARAEAAAALADASAQLTQLFESGGGLAAAEAHAYLREADADRKAWRSS